MASFGYGNLTDRAYVGFEPVLEQDAWKSVVTQSYDSVTADNVAALMVAPLLVNYKLRLRLSIGSIIAALGATPLTQLDESWDGSQRRLFHRIAIHLDARDRDTRAAAERLSSQLLLGTGVAQTQLDFDAEVDFGRKQIALTQEGGPLAEDAKKLGLTDALAEVQAATEALAAGLGRDTAGGRKAPSRRLREALNECSAAFNAVHDGLAWLIDHAPPGPERDQLVALVTPLERLLERNAPAPVKEATPAEPAKDPAKDPEPKPS